MVRKHLKKLYDKSDSFALSVNTLRHAMACLRNFTGFSTMFQTFGTTRFDRHPQMFTAARDAMRGRPVKKLLSYGCSTGEEAFSLSGYFPEARIYGTDINKDRLKIAQANNRDSRVTFFLSNPKNLRHHGPYDLIFAMSVFIRHPEDTRTENLSLIFPFKSFEKGVAALLDHVEISGLLVIRNANYRVMDTNFASRLEVVVCPEVFQAPEVPLFAKNGVKQPSRRYDEQIFRRIK